MKNVSVVLTCYNGARWISEAIESILAQTYEDFELIIIDDGSTDDSKEMVASHLSDERVRYIYQENRGFSAAVNRGIKEGRGTLVGFIGQDDLWVHNKLELQVKYLSEHKDVDLVHSNYCSIDSEGRILSMRDVKIPNGLTKKEVIERLFLNNFIGFETVLVKRKCFDEVGFFDERMVGFSDHDMWLRIAGNFNIEYLNIPLVKKREHEFQLSKIRAENVMRDEFLMVKKAVDHYPFLVRVERKKLPTLYYSLGIALLQRGEKKKAKQELIKAIICQPWKLKAIAVYMMPSLYAFILDRYKKITPEIRARLKWLET
jgi:glycosyltransferase involved in cell wall biosynthesis